jgi:PIN domain nuclease of toxin-antitoxin system
MKLLLDTHLLLWAAGQPDRLSDAARVVLLDPRNSLFFSVASIWEIVIKRRIGRDDFKIDAYRLRKMLIVNGYTELSITAEHVLRGDSLPMLHKDPFDRLLVAQARSEAMQLLTVDSAVIQYGEAVLAA